MVLLISHGGQNPLEPAREGNYILYGPYIDKFKEVYRNVRKIKNCSQKLNSLKKYEK